jgi:LacI family transcriptional regulator
MVGIKDVAEKAGVSTATVSLVLNKRSKSIPISQATRARVLAVANELGYLPDAHARALRTRKSDTVGILAFDIVDPYCANVIRGAGEVINDKNYFLLLSDLQNEDRQLRAFIKKMNRQKLAGLLILASSLQIDDEVIYEIMQHYIPFVVIGREVANPLIPTIATDSISGGYLGIEHLIRLGHDRIAFILGPPNYIDSLQRFRGIRKALDTYKVPLDDGLVAEERSVGWAPESGYEAMKDILNRHKRFTALFTFDDVSAFGAIRAICEANMRVPHDISVVGFDDLSASAFYNPPLTTIGYSTVNMGRKGAQMLFRLIEQGSDKTDTKRVLEEVYLIQRESTAAAPDREPRA